jgi:hypothetical protein
MAPLSSERAENAENASKKVEKEKKTPLEEKVRRQFVGQRRSALGGWP